MKTTRFPIAPEIGVMVFCLVLARLLVAVWTVDWAGRTDISDAAEYLRVKRGTPREAGESELEVVAFGSSRMRSAFRPSRWAEKSGLESDQVANLAVDAGSMWEAAYMLRAAGGLPPSVRLVVVELSAWSFNRGRLERVDKNTGGRELLGEHLRQFATLADRWHIDDPATRARYLLDWFWPTYVRQPLSAWREKLNKLRQPRPAAPPPPVCWDPKRYRRRGARRIYSAGPMALVHFRNSELSEFEVRNLEILLEQIASTEAQLLLVQIPVRPAYVETVRANSQKRQLYGEVQRIAFDRMRGRGRFLAFETADSLGLDESIFVDYGHYSQKGADQFTSALYDRIAPWIQSAP